MTRRARRVGRPGQQTGRALVETPSPSPPPAAPLRRAEPERIATPKTNTPDAHDVIGALWDIIKTNGDVRTAVNLGRLGIELGRARRK